jgi:hypothetical protein
MEAVFGLVRWGEEEPVKRPPASAPFAVAAVLEVLIGGGDD